MLVGSKSKGHANSEAVSLPLGDWPCNCVHTPAPGAASTAALTSPMRTKTSSDKTEIDFVSLLVPKI